MADEHLERRVDAVEGRVGSVEGRIVRAETEVSSLRADQVDIRREVADIRTGLATLHGDLKVNNALTNTIKDSVARIESNTSASFDRIEKHTRESLNEMRDSMQESNRKVQGAVDLATTAKVVGSKPIITLLGWFAGGAFAAVSIAYLFLKGAP